MKSLKPKTKKYKQGCPINKVTGTRLKPNTQGQHAFDCIVKYLKSGIRSIPIIKLKLDTWKNKKGNKRIDSSYFNYVVRSHPDYFIAKGNKLFLVKKPIVDKSYVRSIRLKEYKRRKKFLENTKKLQSEMNEFYNCKQTVKIPLKVTSAFANPNRKIRADTGTRFKPNTSQQIAFYIVYCSAKRGLPIKTIKKRISQYRKEYNRPRNLNSQYFNWVVAAHPDYFQCYSDGTITAKKRL